MLIDEKRNEKQITVLGKEYGLVTPYTSLLVLDSLEQYVQYEIAPPKSLAAMREEYMRRIDTVEHQKQKQKADKLAEVLRLWDERVKWWNAEYKYANDFKYKGEQEVALGGRVWHGWRHGRNAGPSTVTGARGFSAIWRPIFPGDERACCCACVCRWALAAPTPLPRDGSSDFEGLRRQIQEIARATHDHGRAGAAPPPEKHLSLVISQTQEVHEADAKIVDSLEAGGAGGRPTARQPGIVIKPWQPDMPYLKDLRAAKGKAEQWAVYMKNRAQYGTSPGFFLDCSDFFREAGDDAMSLQVLSNIAELELEDAPLLRVLAYRLLQIGQLDLAVQTFEQVLEMRPEEPQSYRDLALALARRAEEGSRPAESIRVDYARAIDLLTQVAMGRWDDRFPEIEVIALEEVNRIIPRAKAAGVSVIPLDPRLIKLLDFDVRIVMTWSADNTDIDLWVTEPSGEKAFYQHNRTTIGGLVSRDFTQGYGPEEYLVRRAAHGMYKIDANYFGSQATRLLGPVTVQVDVLTNYGRPNEQRKSLTLRLKEAKETVRIGEIEF